MSQIRGGIILHQKEIMDTYDCIESITPYESNGIAQYSFANCLWRTQSRSRSHSFLRTFDDQTGVQFDIIWMIVELAKFQREMRIGGDVLKFFVLDETEKKTEFIQ